MALDRVTAMMPNSALGGAKSSARLHIDERKGEHVMAA